MNLYIDMEKGVQGKLNTAKLVKKPVMVRGKNGKVFTRMQWVNPRTGEVVKEKGEAKEQNSLQRIAPKVKNSPNPKSNIFSMENRKRFNLMGQQEKKDFIYKLTRNYPKEAEKISKLIGKPNDYDLNDYLNDYFDSIPLDFLVECEEKMKKDKSSIINYKEDEIIQFNRQRTTKKEDIETEGNEISPIDSDTMPVQSGLPKLGLRHTNPDLPEKEIQYRHGEIGPISKKEMDWIFDEREGTSIIDEFKLEEETELLAGTSGETTDADVPGAFQKIFKTTTLEGINHVFSTKDVRGKLMDIMPYYDIEGNIAFSLDFDLYDRNSKEDSWEAKVGSVTRVAYRDEEGLHIYNEVFQVNPDFQGKGIARDLYERTEQYWRKLSDGHPFDIGLMANISIGVYAWAKKGFDFASESSVSQARSELLQFCKHNRVNLRQTLNNGGYEDLQDLQHSWQFASLDDGNIWKFSPDLMTARQKEDYIHEVKGSGHLGKAFMLYGKTGWTGTKEMNTGKDYNEIQELFSKFNKQEV